MSWGMIGDSPRMACARGRTAKGEPGPHPPHRTRPRKAPPMSGPSSRLTRRSVLKRLAATGFAAPIAFRAHAGAAPSETVYHASFGASGMAGSDIGSLTASPHLKLVAVADVDLRNAERLKKRFP